ncbi:MAG: hypothetical protein IJ779_10975 [Ruminococcus sp.]|nr:hypothetical protein [Ruminococcus sp.]
MGNRICFKFNSDNIQEGLEGSLKMSNGGTSVFINVLCLSGGRFAETESQKRFMVFLAEKNQYFCGIGTVDFDIVEMPWDKASFDDDKAFMLRVIDGAKQKIGWESLRYRPNEEFVNEYLETFKKLIERMTVDDIIEENLIEWLSEADENDPVKCGFPKCKIHDAYISVHGCQVCTD